MQNSEKGWIGGRYRILRSVDEGGTSYIFLVEDDKLGGRYAMKMLKPELSTDKEYVAAFKREVGILKKLKHKNGTFITTKKDSAMHGFGTISIKKIVSKYNGNISFSSSVEEFVVNISIPIPQNLN